MRLVTREKTYNTMDKNNAPAAVIQSGETVQIQTKQNNGDWLQSIDDRWDPSKSKNGPNLCTVVAVDGACPGDTLAVAITYSRPVNSSDKEGVNWSQALKLPLQPMIGTIGTAPAGEGVTNKYAYPTGGNMDVQEICPGTTIYLPVCVPGALLHVGDVHAIMGDGEISMGGGIECRATVTLRVTVQKGYAARQWLRAENAEYIMTIANEIRMKDSFCEATRELIHWMCDDYDFTPQEAYLLLGQVLEARCTMLHGDDGPFSPYICKIKKKYLKADPQAEWR